MGAHELAAVAAPPQGVGDPGAKGSAGLRRPGLRRQQIHRLLGLALRLHEARRDEEAVWFGFLAYCLDPDDQKAAAYLRQLGVPVSVGVAAPSRA